MRSFLSFALGSSVVCFAALASAHIDLNYPPSRVPSGINQPQKASPCGAANAPRSQNPTVLQGGQELTVEWTETINHASHYRIALILDGENFPDPTSPTDFCNPDVDDWCIADNLPDNNGGSYQYTFTLPNVDCDNCTLQLIQYMKGPGDASDPLYFRCADIVIEATDDGGGPDNGQGNGNMGGANGVGGSSATGGFSNSSGGAQGTGGDAPTNPNQPTGGTGNTEGSGGSSQDGNPTDEQPPSGSGNSSSSGGGCSVSPAGQGTAPWGVALLLGLVGMGRLARSRRFLRG